MMIKLCAFADESSSSLDGQIDALKRNNIPYLEIRSVEGKNVSELTDEEAQKIYEKLSANGLSVWSIGSPLGKAEVNVDFDEYLKKIERVCKIANILKAENIRCFSFFNGYEQSDLVIEQMKKMVAVGKKYGVKMCHENEKGVYGDTLERTVELLDKVEDLYCVYDPANFIQCEQKSEDTLSALHGRAHYFHIKDVIFETGELVPAGEGDGDINKLVGDINDDKVLTLEPHLQIFDAYKSIDDTEMKNKYKFDSNEEAFDTAVKALKGILIANGYKEKGDKFEKTMKAGINLYSIKNLIKGEENFLATAKKLKEMGYEYMQYSGGPFDPEMIARVSKESGMPVVLTHVSMDRIINDTDKLMEEHALFGCKNIGLGALDKEIILDEKKLKETIAKLNDAGKRMAEKGFKFFYHNHHMEFYKHNGQTVFDYIIENAPYINFTVDTYWLQNGGVDVVDFLDKLNGRIECVHLKDYAIKPSEKWFEPKYTYLGDGTMNFPKIVEKMKTLGVKYYLVEQDNASEFPNALELVENSIKYIKNNL